MLKRIERVILVIKLPEELYLNYSIYNNISYLSGQHFSCAVGLRSQVKEGLRER